MLVADLRRRITGQEYTEWYIYYKRVEQREELEMKRVRR